MSTRVGYAGGTTSNPNYQNMGDYIETIEMDYDPSIISYNQLLDIFWKSRKHNGFFYSRQYMSAIFVQNQQEKEWAQQTKEEYEKKKGFIRGYGKFENLQNEFATFDWPSEQMKNVLEILKARD